MDAIGTNPAVTAAIAMWEAWAAAQRAYRQLPGLSLGVVYDQQLIWAQGIGTSDREQATPATPATIYRIASITKLFTATAIMQLRDAGRLRLDDPVAEHLPWFQVKPAVADAPAITIRHLLTHTAGLPRESPFPYWTDGAFPSREQLIAALPDQQAVFAPETRWKYSNLALTLAGEVVQASSGQPYADYMHAHILAPLGMESTSVALPDAQRARLATGYGRRMPDGSRAVLPFTDCAGITPAANMASTVEDLARFAMLQFRDGPAGGAQIVRGSTLREMQRVQWLHSDWLSGWGLGFVVRRREDRTLIEHGGAVPGYRTQLSICPADKLAFIVLTNADDGEPATYVEQAHKLIAPAIRKAAAPPPAAPPDPAWQRYAGTYRNIWGDAQVLLLSDGLAMFTPEALDPQATLLRLAPVGEHTFRVDGESGYSNLGELAVFELGDDGQVARLKVGANYTFPVRE